LRFRAVFNIGGFPMQQYSIVNPVFKDPGLKKKKKDRIPVRIRIGRIKSESCTVMCHSVPDVFGSFATPGRTIIFQQTPCSHET